MALLLSQFNYAPVVQEIGKDMMKKDAPKVSIGDTVKVGVAVVEGKGKTRTQTLEGTIIAEHGSGINKTVRAFFICKFLHAACCFMQDVHLRQELRHAPAPPCLRLQVTFRRVFQGVGIELILPVHSPAVESVKVVRSGRVRRAKLYYLRDRIGKAAKLKEIVGQGAEKRN